MVAFSLLVYFVFSGLETQTKPSAREAVVQPLTAETGIWDLAGGPRALVAKAGGPTWLRPVQPGEGDGNWPQFRAGGASQM